MLSTWPYSRNCWRRPQLRSGHFSERTQYLWPGCSHHTYIEQGSHYSLRLALCFLTWLPHMTQSGILAYSISWALLVCMPNWTTSARMKFSGTPWRRRQSCRIQKNGFLQCLVLAPILFNLCTNDLPVAACRKFIYADDICLGKQARTCAELEGTLTAATARMEEYCRCWRLKPSISKTVQRVVQKCCKGKDESLSRRGKFDPPATPKPLNRL